MDMVNVIKRLSYEVDAPYLKKQAKIPCNCEKKDQNALEIRIVVPSPSPYPKNPDLFQYFVPIIYVMCKECGACVPFMADKVCGEAVKKILQEES